MAEKYVHRTWFLWSCYAGSCAVECVWMFAILWYIAVPRSCGNQLLTVEPHAHLQLPWYNHTWRVYHVWRFVCQQTVGLAIAVIQLVLIQFVFIEFVHIGVPLLSSSLCSSNSYPSNLSIFASSSCVPSIHVHPICSSEDQAAYTFIHKQIYVGLFVWWSYLCIICVPSPCFTTDVSEVWQWFLVHMAFPHCCIWSSSIGLSGPV